jgi:hypothetical protein
MSLVCPSLEAMTAGWAYGRSSTPAPVSDPESPCQENRASYSLLAQVTVNVPSETTRSPFPALNW